MSSLKTTPLKFEENIMLEDLFKQFIEFRAMRNNYLALLEKTYASDTETINGLREVLMARDKKIEELEAQNKALLTDLEVARRERAIAQAEDALPPSKIETL